MTVTSFFSKKKDGWKSPHEEPPAARPKSLLSFTDPKVYISLSLLVYLYKHFI